MTKRTLQASLNTLADVDQPQGVQLATLTRYDIPALASLHVIAYGAPSTAENLWESTDEMRLYFEGAFGQPRDDSFIGAWRDGSLVGAILCVTDVVWDDAPRGPFVIDLIVDPECRREGIATVLIAELARRCASWGENDLSLRLDLKSAPDAQKLYDALGFVEVNAESDDSAS